MRTEEKRKIGILKRRERPCCASATGGVCERAFVACDRCSLDPLLLAYRYCPPEW